MRCAECDEAKRIGGRSCWCVLFGIFIREDFSCKYWRERVSHEQDGGGDDDQSHQDEAEAGLYEDGGGDPGEMPGILYGSWGRSGIPGMEAEEDGGTEE